ncbi:putative deadenylation-dependent decapping of nuclear-transcribed mRNA [Trypoxylus dichotomus]
MADTFFGFDTSINHGDHMLSTDEVDCIETEEEEYDALNDETFGTIEDGTNLDDWERQHEELAEIAESSRHTEQIENSISQLVLDDSDDWMVKHINQDDIYKELIVSNLLSKKKVTKPLVETKPQEEKPRNVNPVAVQRPNITTAAPNAVPKNICTVEELERGLLNNRIPKPQPHVPPQIQHPLFPPPHHPLPRLPPGYHPLNLPPPLRPVPPMPPHMNLPPGLVRMINPYPGMPGPHNGPHLHQHRLMGHAGVQFPVNHPFNFPPPPRNPTMQNMNHMNRAPVPRPNTITANVKLKPEPVVAVPEMVRDDYAGLMTNREKQWLLNIQLSQLNTGTPYFDDYYYTVFKERKAKNNKENHQHLEKPQRYHNRGSRDHYRNNDRQEVSNPILPRVYTPLQFENSLGKLQCGSVTAPRKIIDMDVVTLEKDQETVTVARDIRKIKQLLLELEALYSLILKAEDLSNPTALLNMAKLRELKQKQRLREIEAAPTSEQKQEVFKLLQQESIPVIENPHDYFSRVVNGLIQDEKYSSFFNIRKGKMLLLRILPHLSVDSFSSQLAELWLKILLSIPMIGRRDTAGDNLLPRLHPFFKRYIQTCKMSDILEIVSNITEVVRHENNNRSTPLSHQGKTPLHFIIGNKLGVSSLVTMFVRSEYLISSDNCNEKQQSDWFTFIVCWSDTLSIVANVATPIEQIPMQIFTKHCNRINQLTSEKRSLFEAKLLRIPKRANAAQQIELRWPSRAFYRPGVL